MYRYETHLHTKPVSGCARATVRETVEFYKQIGYDGIFVTNHFVNGNVGIDRKKPYEEKIEYYFSDYEEAVKIGKEVGLKVFLGVEMSHGGAKWSNLGGDFLVYGLDKQWYLKHPEIEHMEKSEQLPLYVASGALVIHAHPFRQTEQIWLYPHVEHGVEIINAGNTDRSNQMAKLYAEEFGLAVTAGSDNHVAGANHRLAGIETETPIESVEDFIERVKARQVQVFQMDNPLRQ